MTRLTTVDPIKPSSTCHFDWLTVVFPIPETSEERSFWTIDGWIDGLLDDLYLGDLTWESLKHGIYTYDQAKASGQSIIVSWNEPHKRDPYTGELGYAPGKSTVMIQMSGEGVETLESILNNRGQVIADFVRSCFKLNGHFTRVDACTNFFNWAHFYSARYVGEQIEKGCLITRSTSVKIIKSFHSSGALPECEEAYQGSREGFTTYIGVTPKQLRIYNKLAERSSKINRFYNVRSWSRWEFQLNGDQAQTFMTEYRDSGYDLVQTWTNWLASSYRFIDMSGKKQAKKSRYPTARWWKKLVSDANKKIKVRAEKQKPSFERQKKWIDRQVLPTAAAMYQARYKKYVQNGLTEIDAKRQALEKIERDLREAIDDGRIDKSKVETYLEEHKYDDDF
ncbi:replication initiation factor domain-containing protein [Lactobacillus delbrueckii subsp. bulgaricus]|nr:hypothetical protein [Lactobacillus delbrueckii subsp. bulgaricus]